MQRVHTLSPSAIDCAKRFPGAIVTQIAVIGEGTQIEPFAVVGYENLTRVHAAIIDRLEIGKRCLIRTGATVYNGSAFGDGVIVSHGAVIREGMTVGHRTCFGNHVTAEGYARIGSDCTFHAGSHLTSFMEIADKVFFGPGVITCNDPKAAHFRSHLKRTIKGPTIEFGARVGAGATILPGVRIGENAVIGAGAVVTRNVGPRETWVGVPALKIADVPLEEYLHREHTS